MFFNRKLFLGLAVLFLVPQGLIASDLSVVSNGELINEIERRLIRGEEPVEVIYQCVDAASFAKPAIEIRVLTHDGHLAEGKVYKIGRGFKDCQAQVDLLDDHKSIINGVTKIGMCVRNQVKGFHLAIYVLTTRPSVDFLTDKDYFKKYQDCYEAAKALNTQN